MYNMINVEFFELLENDISNNDEHGNVLVFMSVEFSIAEYVLNPILICSIM